MHMRKIYFKLSKLKRSVFVGWQQQVAEWKKTCRDDDAVEHYTFFFPFCKSCWPKTLRRCKKPTSICYAFTCVRCFLDFSAIKLLRSMNLTLLSLIGKPANYAFSLWSCGWPRRLQSKGFACRQQRPIAIYFMPFMRFVWAQGTVIFPEPFQFITWHSDLCAWPLPHAYGDRCA